MDSHWPATCERHRPAIVEFLARRLRRRDAADDLCQEVFARVLRADPQLRDPERARAYLFSAARHALLNHLERERVMVLESDLPGDGALEAAAARGGGWASPAGRGGGESPEDSLRLRRLAGRVEGILQAMPADLRQAFELGVIEKRRYADIARATGWSLPKVKISVFRARKRLIQGLRGETGPPEPLGPERPEREDGGTHEM